MIEPTWSLAKIVPKNSIVKWDKMKQFKILVLVLSFFLIAPVLADHVFTLGSGACGYCGPYDDGVSVLQDTPVTVAAPGVLENDYDDPIDRDGLPPLTEADVISAIVVAPSYPIVVSDERGTMTLYEDGAYEFIPTPDYCRDEFRGNFELWLYYYDAKITYAQPEGGEYVLNIENAILAFRVECQVIPLFDEYELTSTTLDIDAVSGVLANDEVGSIYENGDFVLMPTNNLSAELLDPPVTFTRGQLGENDVPIYFTIGGQTDFGAVSVQADGSFVYIPDPELMRDFCMTFDPDDSGYLYADDAHDHFWYRATLNGTTYSNVSSAVIDICTTPLFFAEDFDVETQEDVTINIDLLSNVIEVPSLNASVGALSVESVSAATFGDVVLNLDGTASYIPPAEWSGVASFDYTLTDGTLTETGTVHVIVAPVNDAPVCNPETGFIFPPNGRQVYVYVTGVSDVDSSAFDIMIDSITSTDAGNGMGDGNNDPDWSVSDGWVRAERSGTGSGRTYVVSYSADDLDWTGVFEDPEGYLTESPMIINEAGSSCSSTVTMIVPHDQGSDGVSNSNSNGNANGNGNGSGNSSGNANSNSTGTSSENSATAPSGNGNNGLGNSGDNGNAQGDPQRPDNTSGNANGNGNGNGNGGGRP